MNETLIKNINDNIGENDILFHLGDWSFGGIENIMKFRERIFCKNFIQDMKFNQELYKLATEYIN